MKQFLLLFFVFTFSFVTTSYARIDIIPRKIVMDSRDRSAEVTILNLYDTEGTFRVDVIYNKQDENGVYQSLESPLHAAFDGEKIVRFSPRQFTLPAGGRQKIRISLRKPADLPEGEYRFHVKVLRFADDEPESTVQGGLGIVMKMNVGVSIPVVVRHGNLEPSTAQIGGARIVSHSTESGKPELHLTIERGGEESAIGSLEAVWEPAGYSEVDQIGYIDNMNIFTDVSRRHVKLPLKYVPNGDGVIRLRYVDNASPSTKGRVIDELILD